MSKPDPQKGFLRAIGWIQEQPGSPSFCIWVVIATIPAFIIAYYLPLDPEFGKKDT